MPAMTRTGTPGIVDCGVAAALGREGIDQLVADGARLRDELVDGLRREGGSSTMRAARWRGGSEVMGGAPPPRTGGGSSRTTTWREEARSGS